MCNSEGLLRQVNSFLAFSFIAGDVKGLGPVSILPHLSVKGRNIMRALLVTSSNANRLCGHMPTPDVCSRPQISERELGQGLTLCV